MSRLQKQHFHGLLRGYVALYVRHQMLLHFNFFIPSIIFCEKITKWWLRHESNKPLCLLISYHPSNRKKIRLDQFWMKAIQVSMTSWYFHSFSYQDLLLKKVNPCPGNSCFIVLPEIGGFGCPFSYFKMSYFISLTLLALLSAFAASGCNGKIADFDAFYQAWAKEKASTIRRSLSWTDAYGKHKHLAERPEYR